MVALNYEVKHIARNQYSRPGDRLNALQAVVIHYTANHGGDAEMHYRYFTGGGGGRYAGAHIFVDRNKALEIVPLNEVCYHANERTAGPLLSALKATASFYPGGNANLLTVGIEMCMERDGTIHPDTVARTQLVIKRLQATYPQLKDTHNRVVRHYDVTGKNCPAPFVASSATWNAFLDGIDAPKPKPVVPPKVPTVTTRPNPAYTLKATDRIGEVVIGKEVMNYRTEPKLDAPILRQLPAGESYRLYEERGHWLRLGVGWISNAENAYATVTKYAEPPRYDMSASLRKGLVVLKRESNYHAEPKFDSRVLSVLPANHGATSAVHIYDEQDGWLRLGQGWVRADRVERKPLPAPKPPKPVYRVIIDGKQIGAYSEDDNAVAEARKAIAAGSKNIRIEKV